MGRIFWEISSFMQKPWRSYTIWRYWKQLFFPGWTYLQIICKVEVVERGLHTAVLLHHSRQLLQLVDPEKLGQRHFSSGNQKAHHQPGKSYYGMMTLLQCWALSLQQDVYLSVLRIRVHRVRMFMGLLDPDPLVRGMDSDPNPSIVKQK